MAYMKADVRKREIISAARSVMERDGVPSVTLRSVAKEAGVALGTMQYVFPTKDSLLRAVLEDIVDEIAALLQAVPLPPPLDFNAAVRGALLSFWDNLVVGSEQLQILQYELTTHALRTPELRHMAASQYDLYCQTVAAWCESATQDIQDAQEVDFKELSRVAVAGIDGLILQYICHGDAARGRRDLMRFADMVAALM